MLKLISSGIYVRNRFYMRKWVVYCGVLLGLVMLSVMVSMVDAVSVLTSRSCRGFVIVLVFRAILLRSGYACY